MHTSNSDFSPEMVWAPLGDTPNFSLHGANTFYDFRTYMIVFASLTAAVVDFGALQLPFLTPHSQSI